MKTMKIKTKEDALLHCFDLWLWLAVTGNDRKFNWPGWEENGGYLEPCVSYCPVCEFSNIDSIDSCKDCAVNWPGGHCNVTFSPFYQWCGSEMEEKRSKWALEIAILALKALTGRED